MKKFSKKGIKRIVALCGAMVIGGVGLAPNVMAEGDTTNTKWTYTVYRSDKGCIANKGRKKYNSTSVYMSCTGVESTNGGTINGASYMGTAYGSSSESGPFSNISCNGKNSPTYTIVKGKKQYLINYIREAGKTYANIYCQPLGGSYLKFSGYWSPDSK